MRSHIRFGVGPQAARDRGLDGKLLRTWQVGRGLDLGGACFGSLLSDKPAVSREDGEPGRQQDGVKQTMALSPRSTRAEDRPSDAAPNVACAAPEILSQSTRLPDV